MTRILVVDDEPHILEVVRAYLVREGYEVSTAPDGDAALELARARVPDLIVLDVMLPRRSGFDVLRQLRADGSTAAVIMLTARDALIDRVAGLEMVVLVRVHPVEDGRRRRIDDRERRLELMDGVLEEPSSRCLRLLEADGHRVERPAERPDLVRSIGQPGAPPQVTAGDG